MIEPEPARPPHGARAGFFVVDCTGHALSLPAMTDANEWRGRSGASWAAEWRRTDRSFAPLTERLLERTREFDFGTVLDIGCGAGELALALARGRPHASVFGVDISPDLIEAACERGAHRANLAFEAADAAAWQPPADFAPDLLVSRHGVMFFDDPAAAFGHFAAIAAPGAALMFSCFRPAEENPIFGEVMRLLPEPPPPPPPSAPSPFAFADPERVRTILGPAGWSDLAFEPFDFAMVVGGGPDPVEDAVSYFSAIGPSSRAAREMTDDARTRFFGRVGDLARRNLHGGLVALRAAAWIVTARKA